MVDIIGFPKKRLTSGERKRLQEFVQEELQDIQNTCCESYEEIQSEIMILAEHCRKFMAVVEDPGTEIQTDLDFSLFLLEGKIRKIRGPIRAKINDGFRKKSIFLCFPESHLPLILQYSIAR